MPDDVPAILRLAAPAKINLFLEVLGKRDDGYHELVTCMVPLALADELTFSAASQLTMSCDDVTLPLDEHNLVMKAAKALQHQTRSTLGAAIHLNKRIPSPAGLGGGSSDAATTLRGLNQLWQTQLSEPELMNLAATIGSDVPFFLAQSAAWCRGRGEKVTPFRMEDTLHLLIVCPKQGLSTSAVYQSLQAPSLIGNLLPANGEKAMAEAIRMRNLNAISNALFNRLQGTAERCLPVLAELRELFDKAKTLGLCLGSLMSGSGSSYFVVCRSLVETQRLAQWFQQLWDGGVTIHGMGTMEAKPGSHERSVKVFLTSTV